MKRSHSRRSRCPKCGSPTHRSRSRNALEHAARKLLALTAYRCSTCGDRYFRRSHAPRPPASRRDFFAVIFVLAVAVVAYVAVRYNEPPPPPPVEFPP